MNRSLHLLLIISILVWGCAGSGKNSFSLAPITHRIKGDYYLDARKYAAGISYFTAQIDENPDSASAHYYLGRLHLAGKAPASGLPFFKKAVALDPRSAEYHFWLGVAHGALDHTSKERAQYLKVLSINPRHQQALTYLGHNYLITKEYALAFTTYDKALALNPGNPSALYNKALALQRLGKKAEEAVAWKSYLDRYPTSSFARNATKHLNNTGDFSYRNHLIGRRTISFEKIEFTPSTADLTRPSNTYLNRLGNQIDRHPDLTLHLIVYLKNDTDLARERAIVIKKTILKRYPKIQPQNIKTSWFGVPEQIRLGEKHYSLNESVNFFTVY